VYKYTRYILVRIYSFNRGHAEREQVTQQVAVFTGFPGDETRGRAGGAVESHATSTSTAAKPPASPPAVPVAPYPHHPLTAAKLLSGI
jgi:hypothetical protein